MKIPTQKIKICVGIFLQHYTFLQKRTFSILCENFSRFVRKATSKINSKLKNENENLRSEVKDYRLLRKVFGHKQIDELLEQARNIKGRKRENPRSR